MGLLSEPEGGGGAWWRGVARWGGTAGVATWVAALAWFAALSLPELHSRTYFSENALLPGLVRSDLPDHLLAERIHAELLRELQDKYADSEEMPVSWLVAKMSQMQLDVYVHNFTLHYPLHDKQTWSGVNVYGVVRGAGLESVLVSAPFHPLSSHLPSSLPGLALMLAFAQHAREQQYWAKDLVFVVTQHEQLGMQAWLEAYHAARAPPPWHASLAALAPAPVARPDPPPSQWLQSGELPARFGHLQAAIHLDIPSPDIKYLVVRGEGLNGAACNLDLVNTVHRLCDKAELPHSHAHHYTHAPSSSRLLHNLLLQVKERASGAPSGAAGLAQRYGVEGVTLSGGGEARGEAARRGGAGWRRLLLVLEGTLRSLNNLLERFHQSYFLYLSLHRDRFVSIGQYMVVVCLACAGLLVRALSLCVPPPDPAPAPGPHRASLPPPPPRLAPLLYNWLALHAASLLLMFLVEYAPALGVRYGLATERSVLLCAGAGCCALAAGCGARGAPRGAAALAAVQLATLLVCLALLNPAAGLLLALVYTPLAHITGERGGGWRGRVSALCCVLAHPLVLVGGALCVAAALTFPDEPLSAAPGRAHTALQQLLTFALIDYRIYGNWMWTCWCWLLPVWCQLFQVATTVYTQ